MSYYVDMEIDDRLDIEATKTLHDTSFDFWDMDHEDLVVMPIYGEVDYAQEVKDGHQKKI